MRHDFTTRDTESARMYDYDRQYRYLRAADQPGWAGRNHTHNRRTLGQTLNRLASTGAFPAPPARALELGCGNGTMVSYLLAQRGHEIYGIDISQTAIDWARQNFSAAGLSGSFAQGDVRFMSAFTPGSLDMVFDGACLHCLIGMDRARCLSEVHRILRPGGVFIVSTMCGLPRSAEAKAKFDPDRLCLLEAGEPYRTLKPLPDILAEIVEAGFGVEEDSVSVNPWWDHATIVARR